MTNETAKRLRLLASALSVLVLLLAAAGGWFWLKLKASLPELTGAQTVPGLAAPVTITRDALGVPTVRGANRLDVARGLGFVHAQDRFFQMDLARRRAAGELAELFGKAALPLDRSARLHEFRARAQTVLARLPAGQRALLDAYAGGVNAGLAALKAKPFEYLVLRAKPAPWKPEDTLLVAYSMAFTLMDSTGSYERSLAVLRDTIGFDAVRSFAPLGTPFDAPLDGSALPAAPLPGPEVINLRAPQTARRFERERPRLARLADYAFPGSNSFALGGARTATGAALIADDMHLDLAVPNIWYRAQLVWPGAKPGDPAHRVTGVTLPGTPLVVVGSNGSIAWAFTNSEADCSDLVVVEPNSIDPSLYRVGTNGVVPMIDHTDVIRVKGGDSVKLTTPWTIWGPILGDYGHNRRLALRWTMHDPDALNFNLVGLEDTATVPQALAIAQTCGIPPQNFLVAGRDGEIGWTICGKLPHRVGFDGRLPVSWAYGDRHWDGWLPAADYPEIINPPAGRLWTANNRTMGGAALAKLGDAGYDLGARATQIRDDLDTLIARPARATPKDLLAIQLDDRALFLERWQKLLLQTLDPAALAGHPGRAALRGYVEDWGARAAVDSVGFRAVRAWRQRVTALVFTPIFAPCLDAWSDFTPARFNLEPALWMMLRQKPLNLLNPRFASWDGLLLQAADDVDASLTADGRPLGAHTWGDFNTARIDHPFSRFLPRFLARFLNMPADQLPGDDKNMPRIQGPAYGASERLVVSPGHEAEGIFEMPGGQSGHPLSPFYRAGHEAWVHGEPTPFLPGPAVYTLVLNPAK